MTDDPTWRATHQQRLEQMTVLERITRTAIDPAMKLLPASLDSPEARVMLLSVGLQESKFTERRQIVLVRGVLRPVGPAKSYWSGEISGGMVRGVKKHHASREMAKTLYAARNVEPNELAIWSAIENDDVLAAGLARLLLWTDATRLPAPDDTQGAWKLYARTWRPGTPRPETWAAYHELAREFVLGAES